MSKKWIKLKGAGNEIMRFKWGYISYNKKVGSVPNPFNFIQSIGEMMGLDEAQEETALVLNDGGEQFFYILNGDWRKQFAKAAVKGFGVAKMVWEDNKEHQSKWSTELL